MLMLVCLRARYKGPTVVALTVLCCGRLHIHTNTTNCHSQSVTPNSILKFVNLTSSSQFLYFLISSFIFNHQGFICVPCLSPNDSLDWPQHPMTLMRKSGKNDGWMDGWIHLWLKEFKCLKIF